MMKSLIYKILIILVFVNGCKAQTENKNYSGINTGYDIYNLKGPVKKVVYVIKGNADDDQRVQQNFHYNFYLIDNHANTFYKNGLIDKNYHFAYRKFNKINNQWAEISDGFDKLIDTITNRHKNKDYYSSRQQYDSLDIKNKIKYQPKYSLREKFTWEKSLTDIYKLNVNRYYVSYDKKNVYIYS